MAFVIDESYDVTTDPGYVSAGRMSDPPFCMSPYAREFPSDLVLTDSDIRDAIRDMEAHGSFPSQVVRSTGWKHKDQDRTNYCWSFGPTACIEHLRLIAGLPHVSLSPASVAAPIKNYQNRGGWATEFVEFVAAHGIATSSSWPDTLIRPRQEQIQAAAADRPHFIALEWFELPPVGHEERRRIFLSALCHRMSASPGYNWWRHQVCATDPLWFPDRNEFGCEIVNSWRNWGEQGWGQLVGRRAVPDDCVFMHTVTPSPGP